MVTMILAISIAFVIVAGALLSLAPIVEWRQRYRWAPYGEIHFKSKHEQECRSPVAYSPHDQRKISTRIA
jgi:hypothetical protein